MLFKIRNKTSESQLRATRNWNKKNREKLKIYKKKYNKTYKNPYRFKCLCCDLSNIRTGSIKPHFMTIGHGKKIKLFYYYHDEDDPFVIKYKL